MPTLPRVLILSHTQQAHRPMHPRARVIPRPLPAREIGMIMVQRRVVPRDPRHPRIIRSLYMPIIQFARVRRPTTHLGGLFPRRLAALRDHADGLPARAELDVAEQSDEPGALVVCLVLHACEEERERGFAETCAEGGREIRTHCRRGDAADDLADAGGVLCCLLGGDAGGHHGCGRHVRVASVRDYAGHVVHRPDDAYIVGTVEEGWAEGCEYGRV